jgi:hypothetical protein
VGPLLSAKRKKMKTDSTDSHLLKSDKLFSHSVSANEEKLQLSSGTLHRSLGAFDLTLLGIGGEKSDSSI